MPGDPILTATRAADPTTRRRRGHDLAVLGAVGLGGALGGMARYQLAELWPTRDGGFPWATLAVNVVGSLLLGVVLTVLVDHWPPSRYLRPFVGVGLLGGFTTWSTFMTESVELVRVDRAPLAVLYVLVTLAGGLAAATAGLSLGRRWGSSRRQVGP